MQSRISEALYEESLASDITVPVLRACENAGSVIHDLKFSNKNPFDSFNYRNLPHFTYLHLPHSLRTLSITVDNYICTYAKDGAHSLFFQAIDNMRNLENLNLVLEHHDGLNEQNTRKLFSALNQASNLRRLVLDGEWTLHEANFLAFMRQHPRTLRCLCLYDSVLVGNWRSLIHELADTTHWQLEYLSILYPYRRVEDKTVNEYLELYYRKEWPEFTCIIDFGLDIMVDCLTDEEDSSGEDTSEEEDTMNDDSTDEED